MIRYEALCAGYDGMETLHELTFEIPKNRITALIGPNGCGKSTLIKATAGIIRTMSGAIYLDGQAQSDIGRRDTATRIAYMPQSRPAPSITVRQLVSHGRYPHLKWGHSMSAADREIVEEAMVRTDTLKFARRTLVQLSGGERQRAYLAMMLAQQTPVMLLDEPTTYLDLNGQFAMMDLLTHLRDSGRTIAIVLHDLALALEYCDCAALMQDGRLVQFGTPEDIFNSGALAEVFQIHVERTPGDRYLFSPARRNTQ